MKGDYAMQAFTVHTGIVAPFSRTNIDTDAIIPKQFLKRVERSGFGQFLFFEWRFDEAGNEISTFILNREPWRNASILLAQANFGCGSSREHAPWALGDFGFKVILAPSFADIFYNNCFKNGMLPIRLEQGIINDLFARVGVVDGYTLTVDLGAMTITGTDGFSVSFVLDEDRRQFLLQGLDEIGMTMNHESAIREYEQMHNIGA
jgi:3-isopropylmalate/(R)-2-methylmalate dehydratase small subunit